MNELRDFEPLFRRWSRRATLGDDDKRATVSLPWQRRRFGRDAYLAREGEPTKICTLLLKGLAFRQKLTRDGSRQIISFHIAGEFLDLQNCLFDVADHNVQTLTACDVAIIAREALTDLLADRHGLRKAVWLDTLLDASVFREWVVNVGRRDARQRIAHLLCELAIRLERAGIDSGPSFDFPLTQEQIADATGLTAVHTNRMLQSLRKLGLIELSASRLTIVNWDSLAEVGEFNERYLHHAV